VDAERVRDRIRAIVADAEAAFDPEQLWPRHELDADYDDAPIKDLYNGAAGVVVALDALRRRGHADVAIDLPGAAVRTLELWQHDPDSASSLLCGEAGVLLVAFRLGPSDEIADRLFARVRENVENQANELVWGAPGTMVAAQHMHTWTGDQRWREAWTESADELRKRRDEDGLWTQHFSGRDPRRMLGPAHGAVGNQLALLQGDPTDDVAPTVSALERTAVVEDGLANWPTTEGLELTGTDGEIRVQWCHGAAGIVISAASYLPEELLLAGAELTWRAGPHGPRGAGLCHGTAGNGYAFMKVFERTGDEHWLDRARRFAVHALERVERESVPRHSLWKGDIGVALYAADCLDGRAGYPVLDSWD